VEAANPVSADCDPYLVLRVPWPAKDAVVAASERKFAEGIDDLRYDQDAAGALV
jgi:hypothetical protein